MTRGRTSKKRLGLAARCSVGLVAVAVVLAGCGGSVKASSGSPGTSPGPSATGSAAWQQVVDAANKEGKVVVYTSLPQSDLDAADAAFEKAYPHIKVVASKLPGSVLPQRADAEYKTHTAGADVIIDGGLYTAARSAESGYFLPELTGPNITAAVAAATAANYPAGAAIVRGNNALYVSGRIFGLIWNKNVIKGDFTYQDVIDPKYKGRIASYDPTAPDGTPVALQWHTLTTPLGDAWLQGLAANKPKFFQTSAQQVQSLLSGDTDILLNVDPTNFPPNSPISVRYPPNPPVTTFLGTIQGSGAHHNAAQVYLDWTMTQQAQAIWSAGQVTPLTAKQNAVITAKDGVYLNPSAIPQSTVDAWVAAARKLFG